MNDRPPPLDDEYWNRVPLVEAFLAWRRKLVTVEDVESKPILDREQPLHADFANWRKLKKAILPGDELWTFESPKRFWDEMKGWQGILLVRSGAVVEVCVTAMN